MAALAQQHSSSALHTTTNASSHHHPQGIKELVDAGLSFVPHKYVRPLQDTPSLSHVCHTQHVPIIDLAGLSGAGRLHVIQQIASACKDWGFFQVINHGVSKCVIENLWAASKKFFEQPPEERMRYYSEDFKAEVAYSFTSGNPSKKKFLRWKEVFYLRSTPGRFEGFKQAPNFCREAVVEYLKELRVLAAQLYEAIFESLGFSPEYLEKALPGIPRENMAINYYPPCPDPSLTIGAGEHSDFDNLTLLLQDEVGGLQIKKDNKWIAVKPVPEAFVINVADQIELLTNGQYKSVEHRAVTNSERARMSIACFFGPSDDTFISPLPALIDEKHPPLYKPTLFGEYVNNCFTTALGGKSAIDMCRVE